MSRGRRLGVGLVALGVLALVVAVVLARLPGLHGRRAAPLPAGVADSLRAAVSARDWERVRHWSEMLVATEPRNSGYLFDLGLSAHDIVWDAPQGRARSAARTSLDRIERERFALALMDSSAATAGTPEEWARARRYAGQMYENLGLPLDAMEIYAEVRMRQPGYEPALVRVSRVLQILKDPQSQPAENAPVLDVRAP
jgi:hypothetical protein